MSKASKATVMIRVGVRTRELLKAEARRLAAAAQRGVETNAEYNPEAINPESAGVSLDAVVRYLLEFHFDYRERNRRYRERKRKQ